MRRSRIFDVLLGERELKVHATVYPPFSGNYEEPPDDGELDIQAIWEGDLEIMTQLTDAERGEIEQSIWESYNES